MRHHPEEVRAYVLKEVASLCKQMDMNKTINTDDELYFVCRTIVDDFPALKIEELRLAFDRIRKGHVKLYERLKGPEILKALYDYEGDVRAPLLEDLNRRQKQSERNLSIGDWAPKMKEFLKELPDAEPSKGEGLGTRLRRTLDT